MCPLPVSMMTCLFVDIPRLGRRPDSLQTASTNSLAPSTRLENTFIDMCQFMILLCFSIVSNRTILLQRRRRGSVLIIHARCLIPESTSEKNRVIVFLAPHYRSTSWPGRCTSSSGYIPANTGRLDPNVVHQKMEDPPVSSFSCCSIP